MTRPHRSLTPQCSVKLLSRLVEELNCSMARYLTYSRPWTPRAGMPLDALLGELGHEHESFAARIAQLIHERRGTVHAGVFPMDFTYYNDLSLDYLAPRLLEHQRVLIKATEACAEELAHDAEAQKVVHALESSLRKREATLVELLAPQSVSAPLAVEVRDKSIQRKAAPMTSTIRLRQDSLEPQTAA